MRGEWLIEMTRFNLKYIKAFGARLRWRMSAFTADVVRMASVGGRIFGVLSFVASVATIVCMVLYVGYDHSALDHRFLLKLMHTALLVYVLDIAFNAIFRFRNTVRDSHLVKWIGDTAVLLAFLPVVAPHLCHMVVPLRFLTARWYFFTAVGLYSIAELCRGLMWAVGRRTNPSLILSGSFLFFILAGSFVLMLPRCATGHLSYSDTFFLASSAVSMTGLSSIDVATDLSPLGWTVLALLMQIGALGVLTFTSFFSMFFSGRTSIYNQLLMKDFIYSKSMTALVPVMLYILGFTLAVEGIGAVGIYLSIPERWMPEIGQRIGTAAFHSIAAFTNSGFSTIPGGMANPALFNGNQYIYLAMMLLVFAGGIGFPNLVNFKDIIASTLKRWHRRLLRRPPLPRRVHVYDLNTKLVLTTTFILYFGGAIMFFVLEYHNSLEGFSLWKKIVQSLFASATCRSAGFAPISPAGFMNVTLLVMMFLMWVGGASQSMAGGVKVNTFAVALRNLHSLIHGNRAVYAFGRRIAQSSVRRANGVIVVSVLMLAIVAVVLMLLEPHMSAKDLIFETVSAVSTNGLSCGITPQLGAPAKFVLSAVMFLGRVGVLSVLMGLAAKGKDLSTHFPEEDVVIN